MYNDVRPTEVYKNLFIGNSIKDKYDWFKKWYLGLEINDLYIFMLTNNLSVDDILNNATYNEDGDLVYTYQQKEIKLDIPSIKTFSLLFYEYSDNHIAFSNESFLMKYANILSTYYKEFEQTTRAITNLMDLTGDDISIDNYMITNSAEVPETESSTNVEEVDYITVQQKQFNKKGKLQISKELLYNKKSYTTKTFLNRFRYLFVRILSHSYTPVYPNTTED